MLDLIRWMRQWNAVPGHRQVRCPPRRRAAARRRELTNECCCS
ncbi:MAG TPA: hypothetical protein VE078_00905 [Thermoanaerobaculia bacterium]|nr:hypothetical protein [Thermoanaerobaculia bacterium]